MGPILAILAGIGGFSLVSDLRNHDTVTKAKKEFDKKLKEYPQLANLNANQVINQLYYFGDIDETTRTDALEAIKKADQEGEYNIFEAGAGSGFSWNSKLTKATVEVYKKAIKRFPEMNQALNNIVGFDINKALTNAMPNIQNAPTPTYQDVSFENPYSDAYADVEPLKWWTGKELAEHHNLPYDVDTIYDTVKAGTEANIIRDMYTSDALRNEVIKDRPWEEAAYLSSLRNTKSEAVAKGATAGAQAANELLGLMSANQTSAQNQANLVNERWSAVQNSLLADAQARLNANQQYQNLGLNIASSIEGLYENDVRRRQAELEAQAGLNAADEMLRNARIQNNATMYKDYITAQATINAARQSMESTANRYNWFWNVNYKAAKEQGMDDNNAKAVATQKTADWIFQQSTNTQNATNYIKYKQENY